MGTNEGADSRVKRVEQEGNEGLRVVRFRASLHMQFHAERYQSTPQSKNDNNTAAEYTAVHRLACHCTTKIVLLYSSMRAGSTPARTALERTGDLQKSVRTARDTTLPSIPGKQPFAKSKDVHVAPVQHVDCHLLREWDGDVTHIHTHMPSKILQDHRVAANKKQVMAVDSRCTKGTPPGTLRQKICQQTAWTHVAGTV